MATMVLGKNPPVMLLLPKLRPNLENTIMADVHSVSYSVPLDLRLYAKPSWATMTSVQFLNDPRIR